LTGLTSIQPRRIEVQEDDAPLVRRLALGDKDDEEKLGDDLK
jgi:hypothetical protein